MSKHKVGVGVMETQGTLTKEEFNNHADFHLIPLIFHLQKMFCKRNLEIHTVH